MKVRQNEVILRQNIEIGESNVNEVDSVIYLGSEINREGRLEGEISIKKKKIHSP